MLFSASIANLLDTCIWGYTLDFINFNTILTMDLKDLFLDIGSGFILYYFFEDDIKKAFTKNKKELALKIKYDNII